MPEARLWAKGNAGQSYKSTTKTSFQHLINGWVTFKVSGTTFHNDSKQFFVVSGRFLDNSLLDDLNNIIFFMVDFWMILGCGQLLNNFWVKHHSFLDRKHRRDEISKTSETF
ncbi:hypothetical protein RhiirC2_797858 [Rhizophagus irregularis]|uniref:Uncharacterized protein n=1 Tax=Rhizophagus irregularis TaxID=588596 RepID=A0A2N1M7E2_9GLOM|nr:hypothetical protein RhiirC2_797858 [Rhizophagus irregularis]